jgi:hypothetical protein
MSEDQKLDYIVEQIGGINKTLEFQSKQLEEHIKRTAHLEERIIPIEDHVKFIQGLVRLSMYLSTIGGLILGIFKLLRKM